MDDADLSAIIAARRAEFARAKKASRADERAAIVAFLRAESDGDRAICLFADAIERGEHLQKESV